MLIHLSVIIWLSLLSTNAIAKTKDCEEMQYEKKCVATAMSSSGIVFEGVFRKGLFKGKRIEGGEYDPTKKDLIFGKFNGQATLKLGDDGIYVGDVKDGKLNGQGTYTWHKKSKRAGSIYVGGFKNGMPNGEGTFTSADSIYVGVFKGGIFNGQGTLTWSDGTKYVGEWVNDNRNGQGTYSWPSGAKYVGEWVNGNRTGQGTYTKKRIKYVGGFKEGKYHGQGDWYNSGRDREKRYIGEWNDGKKQGKFKTTTRGFSRTECYEKDKIVTFCAPEKISKVADETQINKKALTIKGISTGMTKQQRLNVLIDKGYSCAVRRDTSTCNGKTKGERIRVLEKEIQFTCENFNLCSYSAIEAARKLMDSLGLKSMENRSYVQNGGIVNLHCGRGSEGDEVCVTQKDAVGYTDLGFSVTVVLAAGNISQGAVTFD